jgi:hypothetical protein
MLASVNGDRPLFGDAGADAVCALHFLGPHPAEPSSGATVVPLGARAMDLLIILVERANKVVARRTLIERVWLKTGAEQVSLRVHNCGGPEI